MAEDKPKKKLKRTAESIGNICPYCDGVREFSSRWWVEEHIKLNHPEKRRGLI